MKKIILSLIAVAACISIKAQVVRVYDGEILKATYLNGTHKYKVDFNNGVKASEYVEITNTDGTTTKWATMNVGATTVAESAQTAYGDYYAWGATEKWYESITWSSATAATINGQSKTYTDANIPTVAGTTLSSTEDIATIKLGTGWRMPTSEDIQKLYAACGGVVSGAKVTSGSTLPTEKGIYWCDGTETTTYKVPGMLFIDSKGAKVFFPAAGMISNSAFTSPGAKGYYWTSTKNDATTAKRLYFTSTKVDAAENEKKEVYRGQSVRPIFTGDLQPTVKVYEDGVLKATYANTGHDYKTVFEAVGPVTGTAKATLTAGSSEETDVQWVQLWSDGPKWAVFNVGATSVSDYGGLYAWGKTESRVAINTKNYYNGTTDIQSGTYDTATNLWGSNWQMPTKDDFSNLIKNCAFTETTVNGINGTLVTGKGDYAQSSVFFPWAGYIDTGNTVCNEGGYGIYWSSTPSSATYAYNGVFTSSSIVQSILKFCEQSVRAILK